MSSPSTNPGDSFNNRLLYIDADGETAKPFHTKMTGAGYEVDIAADGAQGLRLSNEKIYDAVIVEYRLPGIDGLEVIRRISMMGPIPATVMLTAHGNEQIAVEAMKLGASDYIIKDPESRYLDLFPAVLQRLRQQRLLIEAKRLVEDSQQAIIRGLREVVAVAENLIQCPDMDALFRHTIEMCRDRLGLERCRLFITNDARTYICGAYGINRDGKVIDESLFREEITREWRTRLKPQRRLGDSQWAVTRGPYQDWDGEQYVTFGEGWIVRIPIFSVSGPIGVIVNDTAITGAALDDIKQEVLVVFCSIFGNIIERKRAEAALQNANEDLEKRVQERTQVLVEMNLDRQALSRRLLDVQESERRTIARELHDEIGQALTAVKMNLQAIGMVSSTTPQLEDAMSISERALQQVRNMSLNLRPSILDDLGLVPALRWFIDRQAQRAGLKAHFAADEFTFRIPPEIESTCFRVVQEAMTNVIRHAHAKNVFTELRQNEHEIVLIIRDDGVGFDVKKATERAARGGSLGVLSMQERVHLLDGEINIDSVPPLGTEVWVRIPMPDDFLEPSEERTGTDE